MCEITESPIPCVESIGSIQIITKCTFAKLSDIAFYLLTLVKSHSNICMCRYVELNIFILTFFHVFVLFFEAL